MFHLLLVRATLSANWWLRQPPSVRREPFYSPRKPGAPHQHVFSYGIFLPCGNAGGEGGPPPAGVFFQEENAEEGSWGLFPGPLRD